MRHINTLLCIFSMLMSTALFTSCDEDTRMSMVIAGEWEGDFGMYYTYQTNAGRTYTFDSYDTRIYFKPDYSLATHGYGKQIDFYEDGPYEYEYHYFFWEVKNGDIYIDYPSDPQLSTVITDYHLSNTLLSGHFNNAASRFRLYKTEDYYDWTPYEDTYSYGSRSWAPDDGQYYAKEREGKVIGSDSITVSDETEGKVISHGNRFDSD